MIVNAFINKILIVKFIIKDLHNKLLDLIHVISGCEIN